MPPLVSVLMSVYNGQAWLESGLECILHQSLTDLEFIVIDDGSNDATWELLTRRAASDPRLKPVRNEANLGLTRSLNRGLALAQGRYLARQDVDDVSLPDRLRSQAEFLEAQPEVVLLGSWATRIDAAGRVLPGLGWQPAADRIIRHKMLISNAFFHASVMLRRQALIEHGLAYDPGLPFAQDYDLWSRLLPLGQAANLPRPLIQFRTHPGQISQARGATQRAVADAIAVRNLAAAGLGGLFTPEEVALMRRLAQEDPPLAPAQRLGQFRALMRLIARVEASGAAGDPEWGRVKGEWLLDARRYLLERPRGAQDLQARAAIVAAAPWGALRDVATWLGRALANRLGGGRG
ncbi:MAG: glycosyltransferase family 2 protein [Thermodesulfobacteriota bacterium]